MRILNPPDAVTDLVASPVGSQDGDVQLVWTAPANDNGVGMDRYVVRFATFPALNPSLAETWWLAAASSQREISPAHAAGVTEFSEISGLTVGVTHYFGIKTIDLDGQLSPIDDRTGTAQQAKSLPLSGTTAPAAPLGLKGFRDPTGTAFTLIWEAVEKNADGSAITDLAGYHVYRRPSLHGTPVRMTPAPIAPTAYADIINGQTFFYTVRAVDTAGNESAEIFYADSGPEVAIIFLGVDGQTQVRMPGDVSELLRSPSNAFGVPLTIVLSEEPAPSNTEIVRNVRIQLLRSDTLAPVPLSFPRASATVAVGYTLVGGEVARGGPSPAPGSAIAGVTPENLSLYWNNGVNWIKVGGTLDLVEQTLGTKTAFLGNYQLRTTPRASGLSLDRANVYPRVFTPNGDGLNDRVYFVLENPNGSGVRGEIIDKDGRSVAMLPEPSTVGGIGTTLIWDGHDAAGNVVPGGVYIYRIEGEGRTFSGTVGVAR